MDFDYGVISKCMNTVFSDNNSTERHRFYENALFIVMLVPCFSSLKLDYEKLKLVVNKVPLLHRLQPYLISIYVY